MKSPTFADFNPTKDERVAEIKRRTDELIELVLRYDGDPRRSQLAATHYEQAAMWAVKSLFS